MQNLDFIDYLYTIVERYRSLKIRKELINGLESSNQQKINSPKASL